MLEGHAQPRWKRMIGQVKIQGQSCALSRWKRTRFRAGKRNQLHTLRFGMAHPSFSCRPPSLSQAQSSAATANSPSTPESTLARSDIPLPPLKRPIARPKSRTAARTAARDRSFCSVFWHPSLVEDARTCLPLQSLLPPPHVGRGMAPSTELGRGRRRGRVPQNPAPADTYLLFLERSYLPRSKKPRLAARPETWPKSRSSESTLAPRAFELRLCSRFSCDAGYTLQKVSAQ